MGICMLWEAGGIRIGVVACDTRVAVSLIARMPSGINNSKRVNKFFISFFVYKYFYQLVERGISFKVYDHCIVVV